MRSVFLAVDIDLKNAVYKLVHVLELIECRFQIESTPSTELLLKGTKTSPVADSRPCPSAAGRVTCGGSAIGASSLLDRHRTKVRNRRIGVICDHGNELPCPPQTTIARRKSAASICRAVAGRGRAAKGVSDPVTSFPKTKVCCREPSCSFPPNCRRETQWASCTS